jgi:hypothetical protein
MVAARPAAIAPAASLDVSVEIPHRERKSANCETNWPRSFPVFCSFPFATRGLAGWRPKPDTLGPPSTSIAEGISR